MNSVSPTRDRELQNCVSMPKPLACFRPSHKSTAELRVCQVCLFLQGSDLAHRRPGFVEITCPNVNEFRPWTHAKLRTTIDLLLAAGGRVERGELTRAQLRDMEMTTGFHCNPLGLLASPLVRDQLVPDTVGYDWAHTVLQGGVLVVEVEGLLGAATRAAAVRREELEAWLGDKDWRFPRFGCSKMKQLHRIFSEHRATADGEVKVKASCSELLGFGLLQGLVTYTPEAAASSQEPSEKLRN